MVVAESPGASCPRRLVRRDATQIGVLVTTKRGFESIPRKTKNGLLFHYQGEATFDDNDRIKDTPFSCMVSLAHEAGIQESG
jgi:hypothetical protein